MSNCIYTSNTGIFTKNATLRSLVCVSNLVSGIPSVLWLIDWGDWQSKCHAVGKPTDSRLRPKNEMLATVSHK